VTKRAKDTKMLVIWWSAKEKLVLGSSRMCGSAWSVIKQVGCCGKCLGPKMGWHGGMEKEGANTVVESA
jgi:hypothetical protein